MTNLIERLRDKADEMDRRMGVTNTQAILREAAAALEAAREDSERLDALEALVNEQPDRALLLHHGMHIVRSDERRYAGLGLSNTGRSLRQAIDQALGKENENG